VSSRFWHAVNYAVDRETHRINFDALRDLARKEKPKIIVAGITAYPRQLDFKSFAEIAKEAGAFLLADISHVAGLIIGGVYPDPVPYADVITTTTHKTLRGPRGAMILSRASIAQQIDRAVFPGLQGGPHNHTTAAIGVALKEASTPEFKHYAARVVSNAKVLAEALMSRGFSLVSGGTDTHLILVDLSSKKVIGKKGAQALDRAGIICNYNTVPYDPRRPFSPSGIRLGTPAVTSRGMSESEMPQIAAWMDEVVTHIDDEKVISRVANEVRELCQKFPAPGVAVS
jgi:glycine hydroxymethyltransferase